MCRSQDHDNVFISIWTAGRRRLGGSGELLGRISFFFFFNGISFVEAECLLNLVT